MTKTTVPGSWSHSNKGSCNDGGRSDGSRKMHRVQRVGAIRPDNHVPGSKILHRQTKIVKFHRTPIISGKAMNRKKTKQCQGLTKYC
jgi:hypothetical protein